VHICTHPGWPAAARRPGARRLPFAPPPPLTRPTPRTPPTTRAPQAAPAFLTHAESTRAGAFFLRTPLGVALLTICCLFAVLLLYTLIAVMAGALPLPGGAGAGCGGAARAAAQL
jgi:hypothetical protein